ncbi:hypothetical protein AYI69_g4165 [Smittium culicis]|uniref:Uncharacterized protein n=1 Tax=Smittium culicis TaxID=133412 RepID=A0A1R1YG21_9FUNG|nr:hypothetical protein AYI69_g4165 [Smittium culicis]
MELNVLRNGGDIIYVRESSSHQQSESQPISSLLKWSRSLSLAFGSQGACRIRFCWNEPNSMVVCNYIPTVYIKKYQ